MHPPKKVTAGRDAGKAARRTRWGVECCSVLSGQGVPDVCFGLDGEFPSLFPTRRALRKVSDDSKCAGTDWVLIRESLPAARFDVPKFSDLDEMTLDL